MDSFHQPEQETNMVNVVMTTQRGVFTLGYRQKLVKFQYYQRGFTRSPNQCADLAVRFSPGGVLSLCVAHSIESKLEG